MQLVQQLIFSCSNIQHLPPSIIILTHCPSRFNGASNRRTTRGFPPAYRSSLFNRCSSTSFGCCMRLAKFFDTVSKITSGHCQISWCHHLTTTVRQAVGFLDKISFHHDSLACPLSWFSQPSIQVRGLPSFSKTQLILWFNGAQHSFEEKKTGDSLPSLFMLLSS